jgi:1-acyl-sn-glycerol-3-phosphate acyltransferase
MAGYAETKPVCDAGVMRRASQNKLLHTSFFTPMLYYYLVSVYLILVFVVTSLVFLPIAIFLRVFTGWFDRRLAILHMFSCFWGSCYSWLSPIWSITITGRENIDRKKAYVMACNHQSMLDILIIYRIFLHFKWVAKASLFKIPIIGWNMWLNRYVKIERSSMKSQRKMLKQCAENIRNGSSVMIFPEGTRSRNGELRPFKEGAFLIALQQKTDIVPMVLDGSAKALPEKGFIPRRSQKVCLHILPPVRYETIKDMGVRQVSEHIRSIVAAELVRIRNH